MKRLPLPLSPAPETPTHRPTMSIFHAVWLLGVGSRVMAVTAQAQFDDPFIAQGRQPYSPYPEQNFPNRVFFGDTHLHTSYSTDAGMIGNTLGPDEAYRFVRCATRTAQTSTAYRW